jgi:hypothetical protein
MRARKEINLEEFNLQKEKYSFDLAVLEKKVQEYISISLEEDNKDNVEIFYDKINPSFYLILLIILIILFVGVKTLNKDK